MVYYHLAPWHYYIKNIFQAIDVHRNVNILLNSCKYVPYHYGSKEKIDQAVLKKTSASKESGCGSRLRVREGTRLFHSKLDLVTMGLWSWFTCPYLQGFGSEPDCWIRGPKE